MNTETVLAPAPVVSSPRKLNLLCMKGAARVERIQVDEVLTPEATRTWQPVSHKSLVNRVSQGLENAGYRIVNEAHALSEDHARYFGMFQLEPSADLIQVREDYSLILGLRNSHDKTFPAGLVLGSSVLVCDNLSFSSEIKLTRKHSKYIERDLTPLIGRACGMLADKYAQNNLRFDTYKNTELGTKDAHDLIVRALDNGAVCGSQVTKVLKEYRTPRHAEFAQPSIWALYNAFTEILKETSIFSMPARTQSLHGILDSYCGINQGLALAN